MHGLDQFIAGARPAPPPMDHDDNASIATKQTGVEISEIDHEMKEITIRFEFEPNGNKERAAQFTIVHTQILQEIQKAFEESVIVFDNKATKIGKIDITEWVVPTMHSRHFKTHVIQGTKRRGSKLIICHRFHTTATLYQLRNEPAVRDLLESKKVYMRRHAWDETKVSLLQIGHYLQCNPQHYSEAAAVARLQAEVLAKNPKAKLPPIRFIFGSPRKDHIRSKAYAIEFAKEDADVMIRILKDTYAGTNKLLLARLRYNSPDAYVKALKFQNHHLAKHYVMPLHNVSNDAMFYLKDKILEIPGVEDVIKTEVEGRYNITVVQSEFNQVKALLVEKFTEMYTAHVPADVKQIFDGLPGVSAKSSDEFSFGDRSFESMSAASFASLDDTSFTTSVTTESAWKKPLPEISVPNAPMPVNLPPAPAATTAQLSDLTPAPPSDNSSLKQQFAAMQVSAEARHKQDQAEIIALKQSLSNQQASLDQLTELLQKVTPALMSLANGQLPSSLATAAIDATSKLPAESVASLPEFSNDEPLTQVPMDTTDDDNRKRKADETEAQNFQ